MSEKNFLSSFSVRKGVVYLKKCALVLLIVGVITVPEELFHFVFGSLEYAFEGFEYVLEELIQHIFHLSKEKTQLYVFYLLCGLAAGIMVWLIPKVPALYYFLKNTAVNYYHQQKQHFSQIWGGLSWLQKALLITLYIPLSLYFGSFLVI